MKEYLLGFVGGLVGIVLIVLGLNYFQIISLSWLNFKSTPSQKSSQTTPSLSFPCPVEKTLCQQAEVIEKAIDLPNFKGLGFSKVGIGTEVKSIIAGQYLVEKIEASPSASNKYDLVNVTIQSDKYIVKYRIAGDIKNLSDKGEVAVNQPIATLSGVVRGQDRFGKNYNLIISIQDLAKRYLNLKVSNNGLVAQ